MRCTPVAKFHSWADTMFRHRKCKELLFISHHGDLTTPNNWCGAPIINLLHPSHLGGEMTSHPSDESSTMSDGLDRLPRPDRLRWVHELAVLLLPLLAGLSPSPSQQTHQEVNHSLHIFINLLPLGRLHSAICKKYSLDGAIHRTQEVQLPNKLLDRIKRSPNNIGRNH